MKRFLLMMMLITSVLALSAQNGVTSLNGTWDLTDSNEGKYSLGAEVPGTVFEALIAADMIEDPFYGTNELKMGEIYNRDWIFSREFEITRAMTDADALFLNFDGIDTISKVSINGNVVLETANMHCAWKIDLKELGLEAGTHQLKVEIFSPAKAALKAADEWGGSLMNPGHKGIEGAPFTRKAWYSFGWDWGAQIPDSGIWKDAYIQAVDKAEIASTQVLTDIQFNDHKNYSDIAAVSAELTLNVETTRYADSDLSLEMTLTGFGVKKTVTQKVSGDMTALKMTVENPNLWWIYEMGSPDLYNLSVSLKSGNKELDSWEQEIGFRTLELVRDLDQWGETFYFRLNKVPVFAKGANWIPCDTFIPRGIKAGLVEKRLKDAKAANFNMIRIWGGGIYESDEFYSICDREGILVWQDFAFACYATPDIPAYYEKVRMEAEQNVKRLRNRASLAIWVGNNEIEKAWKYWGYLLLFASHKDGYDKMFNELLPSITSALDPTRTYWPSSPHSGGHSKNPDDPDYGDAHYWSVWHGGLPFSAYRKFPTRFMSEFGFESFPDMKTIAEFATEDQYDFNSEVMEAHQKNGAGNAKIMRYMKNQFSIPNNFADQVTLSQITQAEAMEYGVDFWRKLRNNYRSMGALYWQFNDSWPVASWSSVDYYGRWKALQYFAKRFYNPRYCSVYESKKNAELWIVNDLRTDEKMTFNWSLQRADGTIVQSESKELIAPAADSFLAADIDVRKFRRGKGRGDLVVFWELLDEKGEIASRGFRLFNKPKRFPVKDAAYKAVVEKTGAKEFTVTLTASENALYTHFKTDYDFTASDNFFHLEKDKPYTVTLSTWDEMSIEEFKAGFEVESFYELIH